MMKSTLTGSAALAALVLATCVLQLVAGLARGPVYAGGQLARLDALEAEPSNAASVLADEDDATQWADAREPRGQGTNIEHARVQLSARDLATAAGHHHHHHHHVKGWLKMGAHTGKKGAFGWHAKYPVGGKGRR